MRFQRYPDGGAQWTLFVWSRHPESSLTWTHSASVTKWRHWCGWLPKFRWDRGSGQRSRGVTWLRYTAQVMVQDKMLYRDMREVDKQRAKDGEKEAFERGRRQGRRDVFRGV